MNKYVFKFGTIIGCGAAAVVQVWVDYIYLDTDERRRFAQVSHEYLIEQLQKDTFTNTAGEHKLNFNHPVKELIWVTPLTNAYGNATSTITIKITLIFLLID